MPQHKAQAQTPLSFCPSCAHGEQSWKFLFICLVKQAVMSHPSSSAFQNQFWKQVLFQIEDKNGPSSFVVAVNHSSCEYFPGYPTNVKFNGGKKFVYAFK